MTPRGQVLKMLGDAATTLRVMGNVSVGFAVPVDLIVMLAV